jgi:hypothetical protein
VDESNGIPTVLACTTRSRTGCSDFPAMRAFAFREGSSTSGAYHLLLINKGDQFIEVDIQEPNASGVFVDLSQLGVLSANPAVHYVWNGQPTANMTATTPVGATSNTGTSKPHDCTLSSSSARYQVPPFSVTRVDWVQ